MHFNQHYDLAGKHALLGASQHAWLNYTPAKMRQVYLNQLKKQRGTELHALASQAIKHHVRLAPLKKALNLFVNDAIGFNMESEQVLYYSDVCFGTADAICFRNGQLRIHDLKTGDGQVTHFYQLDIYAALFCLEYDVDPNKISFVERLYQGRQFTESIPSSQDIAIVMDKIVKFDKLLAELQMEELG
jgi:hypothetical protein